MTEFLDGLRTLTFWELLADLHGGIAMIALLLFGASLVLYFMSDKTKDALRWLKYTLWALAADLALLNALGLTVYVPYRDRAGGPRLDLLADESTAWLHKIVFEHKEFLAFAPMVLVFAAALIVTYAGHDMRKGSYAKKAVLFSMVTALVFVLVVATEAVLVTKVAPVK